MIDLNDYFYFVHVVEKSGFAPAGRALDMPKSRLSRHVKQLEERLGARLIQRTSRQFSVTEVGQEFYRHARELLDQMEAAEAVVKRRSNVLSGRVRLSCSVGMAHFVLRDVISAFLRENPKIDIIQQVTNQSVDLLEDGIDLAVRAHTGPLPDSSLVQRHLAPAPWHLFASQSYLERAGIPSSPHELNGHAGLKLGWRPEQGHWSLRNSADITATVPFTPRLCSDDMVTLKQSAIEGLGIIALPGYTCRFEVETGQLVRLLPEWTAGDAEISLLMPSRRGVLPAVQALSEHLRKEVPRIVAGATPLSA